MVTFEGEGEGKGGGVLHIPTRKFPRILMNAENIYNYSIKACMVVQSKLLKTFGDRGM